VLLQKTLLNIEGLGRQPDPDLDPWKTAKPFLERWMGEQLGLRGFARAMQTEAPNWATTLPQLPRRVHTALLVAEQQRRSRHAEHERPAASQNRQGRLLGLIGVLLAALVALELYARFG